MNTFARILVTRLHTREHVCIAFINYCGAVRTGNRKRLKRLAFGSGEDSFEDLFHIETVQSEPV